MTSIILLSLLILIHELGHFWSAKKFGVEVEEFGIGIPPKAKTLFKRNGTEYTLNWLPLGGFECGARFEVWPGESHWAWRRHRDYGD